MNNTKQELQEVIDKSLKAEYVNNAEEISEGEVMEVVEQPKIDLARQQSIMNNYIQMLPRKMRRVILKKISFSNRFKRQSGLNSK